MQTGDVLPRRGFVRVPFTAQMLVGMAQCRPEQSISCVKGLPWDAEAVRCHYDISRDIIWVVVSSGEFPEVPEGEIIPEFNSIMFKRIS